MPTAPKVIFLFIQNDKKQIYFYTTFTYSLHPPPTFNIYPPEFTSYTSVHPSLLYQNWCVISIYTLYIVLSSRRRKQKLNLGIRRKGDHFTLNSASHISLIFSSNLPIFFLTFWHFPFYYTQIFPYLLFH